MKIHLDVTKTVLISRHFIVTHYNSSSVIQMSEFVDNSYFDTNNQVGDNVSNKTG